MARETISPDNLDDPEVDEKGQRYWRGEPIVPDARLALGTFQSLLAGTVAPTAFLRGLGSCCKVSSPFCTI